jgi:hypothetical protein
MLLALAARDAEAAQPARLWLLVFILAKSALVAWAAAVSWSFRSSNVVRLRGWLRRSPLLGLALAIIVLATLGWPGSDVFEARAALVRLGLPEPLRFAGMAAMLLALASYLRLLVAGLLSQSEEVREAAGDRLRLPKSVAPEVIDDEPGEAAADTVGWESRRRSRRRREQRPHNRFGRTLRLNQPLETSLLVLAGAALAATVAFGGFGVGSATESGIALDEVAGPMLPPGEPDGGEPEPEVTPEAEATPESSPDSSVSPAPSA